MKRIIHLSTAAMSIMLIAALAIGCSPDEPMATDTTSSTGSDAPTFSELDAALALDADDEAVVKAALAGWSNDTTAPAAGDGPFRTRHREMTFVAAVAPSLDDEQLANLVSLLVARREARREEGRERRGDGDRFERLSKQLGLSAEQQTALAKLHAETRTQAEARFAAMQAGSITRDEMRTQLDAIHDTAREQMAAILTTEQLAKMDALRGGRFERRHERRMENATERVERHVALLDAALGLTNDQVSQVTAAMTTMTQAQTSIHEAVKAGTITREQVREQMDAAHKTFEEALTTILTAEQEARLAILEPLIRGRRHHA